MFLRNHHCIFYRSYTILNSQQQWIKVPSSILAAVILLYINYLIQIILMGSPFISLPLTPIVPVQSLFIIISNEFSFINKYLLSAYHVPATVLLADDIVINETDTKLDLM